MCGKSNHALFLAIQEMTVRTWQSGISPRLIFSVLAGTAYNPSYAMNTTINSLIEIGLGFAHPACPQLEA